MHREEKLRQPQFGGIADTKSFSTRLGDSFRGFLFGGGARGEDGSVVGPNGPNPSRAGSNTTGIDIWRADASEDYYAAANANAANADAAAADGQSRRVRPPQHRLDPIDEGRQRRGGGGSADGFFDDRGGTQSNIQGDTLRCAKPTVDFKTKVPIWPGLRDVSPSRPVIDGHKNRMIQQSVLV